MRFYTTYISYITIIIASLILYFNWIVLQVYKNKVISRYTDVSGLVDAVTELLTASQLFMRTKQVFTNFLHEYMQLYPFSVPSFVYVG